MVPPAGWRNPIGAAQPGTLLTSVDPHTLLPARDDLVRTRLEFQRSLLLAGKRRYSPVKVTMDGVIYDGHHMVRAAAEEGRMIELLVVDAKVAPSAGSILDLPVR